MAVAATALLGLLAVAAMAILLWQPAPALAQSPPDAVGSITLTRSGSTLTVSWNAVDGAAKYHALYQADGGGDWLPPIPDYKNITATSFTFDIDSGKSYVVGVRAGNEHGWGAWTDSPVSNPPLPDAVGSITLTRNGSTLTVSWNAVAGAAKYHALYQADGAGDWLPPIPDYQNITATSFTFDIDSAKSYVVGVRAGNSAGWGPWTDSPASHPPLPAAVGSITLTRSDTTLTVSWNAVDGVAKYHALYQADGAGDWLPPIPDYKNITATGFTFNVDNGKSYVVGVRAGNSAGWGPWTDSPTSGPYTPEPQPPAAPAGLTARAGDGSVTLVWDDPGDSSITGYEYNVNHNATGTGNFTGWSAWTAIPNSGADTTSHTFNGLTNGREYRYHLRAVNDAGPSAAAPNAAPWFASATPAAANLVVDQVTGTTATLTLSNYDGGQWYYQAVGGGNNPNWPPAGSPPAMAGAGAGAASASGASNNPNCQGPVNGAQANINGSPGNSLVPGSEYTFTAYDNANCQGAGIASAQANSQSNAPAAPASLVGHRGYGLVDAEWPHVDGATGYNVEIYWWYIGMGWHRSGSDVTGGTGETRTHRITSTGSPNTPAWMGVPNHGQVIIAVQSVNTIGASGWTYSGFIDAVDFPNYPQNVTAARTTTGDKAGQITVGWGQCDPGASWCNGRTPITGYAVNASSDGGASWTKVVEAETVSVPNASLSFCAAHDRNWQVKVGVTNRLGTTWSDAVSAPRYTPTPGSRNACLDFDTLSAAGVDNPQGIWSDGARMWVVDANDDTIYAYKMSDQSRDSSKDITLDSSNDDPRGIWSNGVTMWVVDSYHDKIYAYKMSDKSRDSNKDIDVASDVGTPTGIWSNGVTMWVADSDDAELYAYKMSDKSRDSSKGITLSNDSVNGIWSNGVTMWVADDSDFNLYAYNLTGKSRDSSKDYNSLHTDNNFPFGIWSDGKTMWVVNGSTNNDKLYAYNSIFPFTSPASVNAYRGWGFLDAEWSAVAGASSYDVEHYHPYNRARYGADWRRVGSSLTDTSRRVSGIKNWGGDNIRVRSVSPLGDTSEWSYSGTVDAISSLPRGPVGLSAVQVNDSSIVLSWTQCDVSSVVCNGGTPITGYLVELSNNGGQSWRSGGKIAAPYTSGSLATVTQGVNSGVNRVRVSAETRFRNSDWTAAAVGAASLTASSADPTGGTLTLSGWPHSWRYQRTAPTGDDTCHSVAANTTTAALSSLTANTSYTYTAYIDSGCTTALGAATFSTPLTVSNLSESGTGPSAITLTTRWAAEFTTGPNSSGYTLHSATTRVYWNNVTTGTLTWTIQESTKSVNNVIPTDTVVATLTTGTVGASTFSNVINACSGSGCTLNGDTTYFLVGTLTGSGSPQVMWNFTLSDNESPVPSGNGWEIGKGWYSNYSNNAWGAWATYDDVTKFKVVATSNPSLASSSVTATTATLTLSHYSAAWWLKRTSPADTTCKSKGTTATESLSALTANTSYTYKAYSKDGCNSADEIATATFTTTNPSLTASLTHVSGTTYTLSLTISGWTPSKDGGWYYKHQDEGGSDCTGPGTNTTVGGNNNLVASSSYTYSAYSGYPCTSGNLIATAPAVTAP